MIRFINLYKNESQGVVDHMSFVRLRARDCLGFELFS